MPTATELLARASVPKPRAERTVTLVEAQHLYARQLRLFEEAAEIGDGKASADDENRTGEPRKAGERGNPRLDEIRAEVAELKEQLAEHQSVVSLEGMSGGEWQNWKDEHPPREGNDDDDTLGGLCNTSDLLAHLGRFVAGWDGDGIDAAKWDGGLAANVCYMSLRDLVVDVIDMHEVSFPKATRPISSTTSGAATG